MNVFPKNGLLKISIVLRIVLIASFVHSAQANENNSPYDGISIPKKWESAPTSTPEATEVAARCMGMPEKELQRMVSDAGANSFVTKRASDRMKPYLTVNARQVICVQNSKNGWPILPAEAYQSTINFENMPADQLDAYHIALSRQLAMRGSAQALVMHDTGTASLVSYLFSFDQPLKIHYQKSFLKAGEFDEKKFEHVFKSLGSVTVTARGQPAERYKFFTSDK